jgi:hypothetical protein
MQTANVVWYFHEADFNFEVNMNKKTFTAPLSIKAIDGENETGEFEAVFATLNVKDWHGDVTIPGAFIPGQEVVIEGWNHDYSLPVGKGKIIEDGNEAKLVGRFILETDGGKDHYRTVKELGGIVEWSYTFEIIESDKGTLNGEPVQYLKALDVWGVAPVTRGAGMGTRTTMIKAQGKTEDEASDGKPSGVSPAVIKLQIDLLEIE